MDDMILTNNRINNDINNWNDYLVNEAIKAATLFFDYDFYKGWSFIVEILNDALTDMYVTTAINGADCYDEERSEVAMNFNDEF